MNQVIDRNFIQPSKMIIPENDSIPIIKESNNLGDIYDIKKTETKFWGDDPNVLIKTIDLFPSDSMNFTEQINALTRFILLFSFLLSLIFQKSSFFLIGCLTIFIIWVYFVTRPFYQKKEGFEIQSKNGLVDLTDKQVFDTPHSKNPFSNVLLTDYVDNPFKLPAPPCDEPNHATNILQKAKDMVKKANPTFPNISEKLFKNLGDQYQFEQSLQPFYSNSSTTIPNDQKAFTDFCYGDLISCKEGNVFACARNLPRYGEGS